MLHVHHADHADRLVAGLAEVLGAPVDDVFAIEQVAVHSRGLERWLAQRLSHHLGAGDGRDDGVCAAVEFPFPGRLLGDVLSSATGADPETDPWRARRLVWHLLAMLDAHPQLARDTPLAPHLAASDGRAPEGRFAAARVVADLFDRYGVHRPEMLIGWARGEDGPTLADGRPVPPEGRWQASLWRELRDHLGVPSPAERLADAEQRLRDDPDASDLPARVSLFGLTALPASYLVVLRALAHHRDVHLFLLHPSPVLWDRVDRQLRERPVARLPRRDEDPLVGLVRNPLVRAWGRDAREMQLVLRATETGPPALDGTVAGSSDPTATRALPRTTGDGRPEDTLLARVQADIRGDVAPPGPPGAGQADLRAVLDARDDSVQVHACHGAARQVEVLRDVLLHAFAADPTLEPRDVVVLCTDIEAFAPLVESVFARDPRLPSERDATADDGDGDEGGARLRPGDLRVRIADRALTGTNPLLRVVADILALVDGRVSASDVRDLAAAAPVRRRFGLETPGLDRIDTWIRELGVRWGFDADHRRDHGIETDANTWDAALSRLLVGVAVADEDQRTVGDVVPFDDVAGDDVEVAGRLAELVSHLADATRLLTEPRPMLAWKDAIDEVAALLTDTRDEPWQRVQLASVLDAAVADAGAEAGRVELSLPEVRDVLRRELDAAPGRASHRTGDLTVCTMVPMRSVPHRVVCLLGMDDGTFPRRVAPDGDDLLEHDPRVGDRDPRTEDRQLLLDALLAAGQRLVITYTARDERTNEPRPPAVPVGELLDVVDRTARPQGPTTRASEAVTVHHPLHDFDPRNFVPGALGIAGRAFGSDPGDLAGARALARRGGNQPTTLLPDPLHHWDRPVFDPMPDELVELDDLVRAVTDPIPTLLDVRLGLRFARDEVPAEDDLAVELDGLSTWAVGTRLLTDRLAGRDLRRGAELERLRGTLPPGALARPVLEEVGGVVEAAIAAAERHGASGTVREPVEVDVRLADGRRLVGAVGEVLGTDGEGVLRQVTFSRLGERDRLRAWVRLLAVTAAHPDEAWRAVTIARLRADAKSRKGPVLRSSQAILPALGDTPAVRRERAMRELLRLIELRDLALTRPVPLVMRTSAAYAEAVVKQRAGGRGNPLSAAGKRWTSNDFYAGEDAAPAHVQVFGADRGIEELLEVPAGPDEAGDGWDAGEPSRFGRWALHLWAPLLAHEHVEDS